MPNSNKAIVVDNLPFDLDAGKVLKHMRLHGDTQRYERITTELLEIAIPVARPKAVYKISCVDCRTADSLEIDGLKFNGKLIKDTLDTVDTVFPCVGTCGTELDNIKLPEADVMKRYCLDVIKTLVLFEASANFRKQLSQQYSLGDLSSLNPGELESFPSSEHRLIFALLGDVEDMIGVRLTANCALVPTKSHSSLLFSSKEKFVSCRLCKMRRCQGRRAPFDSDLAQRYPGLKTKAQQS